MRKMNNTLSVSKAQSYTENQNFYLVKFCLFLKTKIKVKIFGKIQSL